MFFSLLSVVPEGTPPTLGNWQRKSKPMSPKQRLMDLLVGGVSLSAFDILLGLPVYNYYKRLINNNNLLSFYLCAYHPH